MKTEEDLDEQLQVSAGSPYWIQWSRWEFLKGVDLRKKMFLR